MPEPVSFFAAMLVGLLGSTHCIAMCGGIVTALSFSTKTATPSLSARLPYIVSYNLGRITTYTITGYILTFIAASAYQRGLDEIINLQIISAIFLILLGLYISRWWTILIHLESAAKLVWKYLEPVSRRWIPVRTAYQAFLVGLIWGWLPCGMVYSALVYAMASADAMQGAMIMLGFGIGTLPTLLLMGSSAALLQRLIQNKRVRQIAGGIIILMGVMTWYLAVSGAHQHH